MPTRVRIKFQLKNSKLAGKHLDRPLIINFTWKSSPTFQFPCKFSETSTCSALSDGNLAPFSTSCQAVELSAPFYLPLRQFGVCHSTRDLAINYFHLIYFPLIFSAPPRPKRRTEHRVLLSHRIEIHFAWFLKGISRIFLSLAPLLLPQRGLRFLPSTAKPPTKAEHCVELINEAFNWFRGKMRLRIAPGEVIRCRMYAVKPNWLLFMTRWPAEARNLA